MTTTTARHRLGDTPNDLSVGHLIARETYHHNYKPAVPTTSHKVGPVLPYLDLTDDDRRELALDSARYAQEELRDVADLLAELPQTPELAGAQEAAQQAHNLIYKVTGHLRGGGK